MNIAVKVDNADATGAEAAVAEAYSLPLAELNPAKTTRFQDDTIWPVFERLRREAPIHYTAESEFGPYWSITKWEDIMAVDTNHEAFSSAEGIGLANLEQMAEQRKIMEQLGRGEERRRNGAGFITMDEPYHGPARKAVSPTLAPANIALMAPVVRERAGQILDGLPIGETFDWVDRVSKELTAMTLATLFDFPFERRRKLPWWSDMMMNMPGHGPVESWQQKAEAMAECFGAFEELWNQRVDAEPGIDLISMLAHNPATRNMERQQYHGNVVLLIVGGNDTTRNTISGSIYMLNKNLDQYDKLRANPDLVLPMVSETIRYQTPLAQMSRVATRDVELGGKTIKQGDRVVMWYISGNRDEGQIDNPNAYIIDRERPRQHMSFGFGIHRCVGNRVAEMQLTIIWEEILKRFPRIELAGEPVRTYSSFVHGWESMPVIIPARA
jgi:cytochrome P450